MQALKVLPPFYSSGTVAQDLPRTLGSSAAEPVLKLRGVAPMSLPSVSIFWTSHPAPRTAQSHQLFFFSPEDCFVPGQKSQKAYLAQLISVSK